MTYLQVQFHGLPTIDDVRKKFCTFVNGKHQRLARGKLVNEVQYVIEER